MTIGSLAKRAGVGVHTVRFYDAARAGAATSLKRSIKGKTGMKSLEVKIDGMHCDGCASTIHALLSHEPGVKSASVSFGKGTASVFYDPGKTDPDRIAAAIEKAGFRAAGRP